MVRSGISRALSAQRSSARAGSDSGDRDQIFRSAQLAGVRSRQLSAGGNCQTGGGSRLRMDSLHERSGRQPHSLDAARPDDCRTSLCPHQDAARSRKRASSAADRRIHGVCRAVEMALSHHSGRSCACRPADRLFFSQGLPEGPHHGLSGSGTRSAEPRLESDSGGNRNRKRRTCGKGLHAEHAEPDGISAADRFQLGFHFSRDRGGNRFSRLAARGADVHASPILDSPDGAAGGG